MNMSRAVWSPLVLLLAAFFVAGAPVRAADDAAAGGVQLNPRHPDRYVVKKGDTLWDISAMFLKDPWYWPEIWEVNPQVKNPHLIYPGDVLTLVYDGAGRPKVQMSRGEGEPAAAAAAATGTEKLSPRVREENLADAIPPIPLSVIGPFLTRGRVIEKSEARKLPHIVVVRDKHLVGAAGNDVYVHGDVVEGQTYSVVHLGEPLREPGAWTSFGYNGIYVGDGTLRRGGDPATLFLNSTTREALAGDVLVPQKVDLPRAFAPHAPKQHIEGKIISVIDGVTNVAQYQVVILNRGSRDGLDPGSVLRIWQAGERVTDHNAGLMPRSVKLPAEPAGVSMVFRTYDRISYALVMQAQYAIHVGDNVRNPN